MALVYYSFYLNEFLVVCCSYFRPQSPELLSSLLPDPEGLTWYQRIPFVLWHLYVMTGFVEAAVMNIFFTFAFILPVMDLVEHLGYFVTAISVHSPHPNDPVFTVFFQTLSARKASALGGNWVIRKWRTH